MVRVCRTGNNPTMPNLLRFHAVSVAYLHAVHAQGNFRFQYEQSPWTSTQRPSYTARRGTMSPAFLALAIRLSWPRLPSCIFGQIHRLPRLRCAKLPRKPRRLEGGREVLGGIVHRGSCRACLRGCGLYRTQRIGPLLDAHTSRIAIEVCCPPQAAIGRLASSHCRDFCVSEADDFRHHEGRK